MCLLRSFLSCFVTSTNTFLNISGQCAYIVFLLQCLVCKNVFTRKKAKTLAIMKFDLISYRVSTTRSVFDQIPVLCLTSVYCASLYIIRGVPCDLGSKCTDCSFREPTTTKIEYMKTRSWVYLNYHSVQYHLLYTYIVGRVILFFFSLKVTQPVVGENSGGIISSKLVSLPLHFICTLRFCIIDLFIYLLIYLFILLFLFESSKRNQIFNEF